MISSIGPNFQGRRDNIDAMINADDNTIRQVAYLKTAQKYNPERERKITNALFYSAPIAAGLATAILSKGGKTKIFSTEVSGLGARAAKGLAVATGWATALGAIDLLGYGKKKLNENSPEARKFDRNHPFLSMAGMLAAGIGAILLVNKGFTKLGTLTAPKFMQKATASVDKFLNNNAFIQNCKKGLLNLAEKTPSALKEIGATALDWSPTLLLFGGLFHSIGSTSRQNREYVKNYTELKEKQSHLAQARVRELSMQNDFLMQDAQNREDMALLNNPADGLPEEIQEKIAELHE